MATMNEDLSERFRRHPRKREGLDRVEAVIQPQQLNMSIRRYFQDSNRPSSEDSWVRRPELPTTSEILDQDETPGASAASVPLMSNLKKGAWPDKMTYLAAHFELLREDSLRLLRQAVARLKFTPDADEAAFNGSVGVYEKVHVCGITTSTRGIAVRVTFSIARAGKKILWQQSKRLISGGLVVLTPSKKPFESVAIIATVAARPLSLVEQNPPEIDLFVANQLIIDPAEEYIMVEHRGSYYEANRHTMRALQKMSDEISPLMQHLVGGERVVSPPTSLQMQPFMDLRAVAHDHNPAKYAGVNVLAGWHEQGAGDGLDQSQQAALRRIITKRLAIVQGPPGTGKTHVSVTGIKVFVANHRIGDPPIIVVCQTNHALDQILRHIATFENDFARLGGRSKDQRIIKQRTLFELRKLDFGSPPAGTLFGPARKKMAEITKRIESLISPLRPSDSPIDPHTLSGLGIISNNQLQSLETGASQWVQTKQTSSDKVQNAFVLWLGRALQRVPEKQGPEEHGFDYEETDLEFEQLREQEAENFVDDDELEALRGTFYPLADNFTCHAISGNIPELLNRHKDLWTIPEGARGSVYRYFQSEMKRLLAEQLRKEAEIYDEQAINRRIGGYEKDEPILKTQRVIGMTTTGFSKYRALISALKPKTVLVEEAAETLEAPVIATCLPSLEQLILVGDHKQLRPHCQVKDLEDKPYYFNVSLFERLMNNKLEYSTLTRQRRMIPEIRRILRPIYGDLIEDHPSVTDLKLRPKVPGMGDVSSYFFSHAWPESRDDQMSAFNQGEADMIVGLALHLIYNGVQSDHITILTFYNGQRKALSKLLRTNIQTKPYRWNIVTVDSYQGEENQIVILSLVRNNLSGNIGFLEVDNRVCVALSRAQCGFYVFGNSHLLEQRSKTWRRVIRIMRGDKFEEAPVNKPCRLDESLPVHCGKHKKTTYIKNPEDWDKINGACEKACGECLTCGHPCPIKCHPFDHAFVTCRATCHKILACSHQCEAICGEECECSKCKGHRKHEHNVHSTIVPTDRIETFSQHSRDSSNSWTSFAHSEPERYKKAAAAPLKRRHKTEKPAKHVGASNHSSEESNLVKPPQDDQETANGRGMAKHMSDLRVEDVTSQKSTRDWSKMPSLLD